MRLVKVMIKCNQIWDAKVKILLVAENIHLRRRAEARLYAYSTHPSWSRKNWTSTGLNGRYSGIIVFWTCAVHLRSYPMVDRKATDTPSIFSSKSYKCRNRSLRMLLYTGHALTWTFVVNNYVRQVLKHCRALTVARSQWWWKLLKTSRLPMCERKSSAEEVLRKFTDVILSPDLFEENQNNCR